MYYSPIKYHVNSNISLNKNTLPVEFPQDSLSVNMVEASTQQIILPDYFFDGYFNLLPGEST